MNLFLQEEEDAIGMTVFGSHQQRGPSRRVLLVDDTLQVNGFDVTQQRCHNIQVALCGTVM